MRVIDHDDRFPEGRRMTVLADVVGQYMFQSFARSPYAVVALVTPIDDPRVIERRHTGPGEGVVAPTAVVRGQRMSRRFSVRISAVVTRLAGAHHFVMVDDRNRLPTGRGGMACLTYRCRQHVLGRLRRARDSIAAVMATCAAARRSFEHAVPVARLAVDVAVQAVEFEPRRKMIERNCRRHRGVRRNGRDTRQEQPEERCAELHSELTDSVTRAREMIPLNDNDCNQRRTFRHACRPWRGS